MRFQPGAVYLGLLLVKIDEKREDSICSGKEETTLVIQLKVSWSK